MRTIDAHSHVMPQCAWKAMEGGGEWYGVRYEPGEGDGHTITGGVRRPVMTPKLRYTPEERLRDMDEQRVDVHVVSVAPSFYGYHLEPVIGAQMARDVNDEIAEMTRRWPERFAGLATLPAQDVGASIDELERSVTVLGMKGAELDAVVNGKTWDEAEFLPLFKAAEEMGAVLFFHPQPIENLVMNRTTRYGLSNSIGVFAEDAVVLATLIFGGILDRCPDLKVCIAHGGGPACFGMGRLDRGWQVRSEARANIGKPPSTYQRRVYYDCLTDSEASLRFLIDQVGADRVVLGSDWPYVPWYPSPVDWIQGLDSLTQQEKDKVLWQNLEALLGI